MYLLIYFGKAEDSTPDIDDEFRSIFDLMEEK
jgi:hypothetical protein